MDIPNTLTFKYPGAQWSVGETYDSLDWMDKKIPKPTEDELKVAWLEYKQWRETEGPKKIVTAEDMFKAINDMQDGFTAMNGFLMEIPAIKTTLQDIQAKLDGILDGVEG